MSTSTYLKRVVGFWLTIASFLVTLVFLATLGKLAALSYGLFWCLAILVAVLLKEQKGWRSRADS